jgi:uncharacterized membrane-anchored protein
VPNSGQNFTDLLVLGRLYSHPAAGATVGDFLDKPVREGGMALSRPIASAVIAIFILACLVAFPQRAGVHPDRPESTR